jgi:hypothetical protein
MLATRLFRTLAQRVPLFSASQQTLPASLPASSSLLSLPSRWFGQEASDFAAPKRGAGARKSSGDADSLNDISKELTFGSGPKISPVLPSTIRHDTLKSLRHEVVHINRIGYVKEGGKVRGSLTHFLVFTPALLYYFHETQLPFYLFIYFFLFY